MQREDGSHLVVLPPVKFMTVPIALSEDVRTLYNEIEDLSRQRFENLLAAQQRALQQGGQAVNVMVCPSTSTQYSNLQPLQASSSVLGMLTRLRQLVLHPDLIPQNYVQTLRAGVTASVSAGNEERVEQLRISPQDKASGMTLD
jgi:SWI/SNF-related matrix-associated actin-dependent regulator of chromatin subfamily A3